MFGLKNKFGAQVDEVGPRLDGIGAKVEGAAPYLDGVGALSAFDRWANSLPRIDLSDVEDIPPQTAASMSKQWNQMQDTLVAGMRTEFERIYKAETANAEAIQDVAEENSREFEKLHKVNEENKRSTRRWNWVNVVLSVVMGLFGGMLSKELIDLFTSWFTRS